MGSLNEGERGGVGTSDMAAGENVKGGCERLGQVDQANKGVKEDILSELELEETPVEHNSYLSS